MVKPLEARNDVVRCRFVGLGSWNFTLVVALSLGLAMAGKASAEALLNTAVKSHSGQFTVQSVHRQYAAPKLDPARVSVAGGWAFVMMPPMAPQGDDVAQKIDPALLVTSCERIKEAILVELNLTDRWRGRIDLNINTSMAEDAEPVLRMAPAPAGWRYDLDLPPAIKPGHLARTLVSVELLEMANRSATEESTQIPFWLVEGMMAQIHAIDSTLLLRPYLSTVNTMLWDDQKKPLLLLVSSHRQINDPRIVARLQRLGSRPPLTFQDLSWPTKDQTSGNDEEFYQACAHLFLYQLLQLNDGRTSLCRFLELLPQHLNWQISFLEAYPGQFPQLRDVEKWWGLARADAAGFDSARWTSSESGRHIQETLEIPVQIRPTSSDLPTAGKTTLQEIVLKWDASPQATALQKACADLVALRPKLTPEYLPLVEHYCRVIESFLKENSPATLAWMRIDSAPRRSREATARQLTDADRQLAEMQIRLQAQAK